MITLTSTQIDVKRYMSAAIYVEFFIFDISQRRHQVLVSNWHSLILHSQE